MPTIHDLDTPSILIDAARAEANIARAQAHADRNGLKLRPHIKTHKLPYWAKKQVAAGAVGITCQKIGEAEVMADAGLTDIFLPYNILGRAKLERLKALHGRVTLSVTADSMDTLEGLAATSTDAGHRLPVLVECDTGLVAGDLDAGDVAFDAVHVDHGAGRAVFTGDLGGEGRCHALLS